MKPDTKTLVWMAMGILATFLVMYMFKCGGKTEDMIRNEVELEQLKEDRVRDSIAHGIDMAAKDSVIQELKDRFANTTPKLQQSKKDYEKVRPAINSLTNNELLRRANSFTPR